MAAKRRRPQASQAVRTAQAPQAEAQRQAVPQPPESASQPQSNARPVRRRVRRRGLPSAVILSFSLLVTVLGVAIFVLIRTPGDSGPIDGVLTFSNLERGHQAEPVTYPQMPPVGGAHNPAWQNCGVYDQSIRNENGVHTLEHGAIWITYVPDLPADQVEALRSLTRQSGYRLLSPYPNLPSPIVVSAWGYQLPLEQASDPRLTQFIRRYEQDPRGPEPGAPCTGGLGRPIS